MLQNITLYLLTSQFGIAISQNMSGMAGFFQRHFAGTDNLRVVSIILLLLAFVLFLFLIVILYIKSLLSFIKSDVEPSVSGTTAFSKQMSGDQEREMDRYPEKDTEKSRERQKIEQQQRQNQLELERRRQENAEKELEARHKAAEQQKAQKQQENQKTIPFPL